MTQQSFRGLLGVGPLLLAGCMTSLPASPLPATAADRKDLKEILLFLPTDENYAPGAVNKVRGGSLVSLGGNKVLGVQHSFPLYLILGATDLKGLLTKNNVEVELNGDGEQVSLKVVCAGDPSSSAETPLKEWVVLEGQLSNGEEWSSPRIPDNVVFDPAWELKRGANVVIGGFPDGPPGQESRSDRPTLTPARVTTGPFGTQVPEGLVYLSVPNLEETQGDSGGVLSVWDQERELWVAIGYLSQSRRWTFIGHPVLVAARFPPEVIDQLDAGGGDRDSQ